MSRRRRVRRRRCRRSCSAGGRRRGRRRSRRGLPTPARCTGRPRPTARRGAVRATRRGDGAGGSAGTTRSSTIVMRGNGDETRSTPIAVPSAAVSLRAGSRTFCRVSHRWRGFIPDGSNSGGDAGQRRGQPGRSPSTRPDRAGPARSAWALAVAGQPSGGVGKDLVRVGRLGQPAAHRGGGDLASCVEQRGRRVRSAEGVGQVDGDEASGSGRRASWAISNTGRHSHRSTAARVGRLPPRYGSGSAPPVVTGTRTGWPCSPPRTAQVRPSWVEGTSRHVSAPATGPSTP